MASLVLHFAIKPLAGQRPIAFYSSNRYVERARGVFDSEPAEKAALNYRRQSRIDMLEAAQCLVQVRQCIRLLVGKVQMSTAFTKKVERHDGRITTALGCTLISRVVAEYLAHRHRRDPEEVNARARAEVIDVYKLEVRFVDEGSRAQGGFAIPVTALPVGDGAELIVDNREQSFERGSVAILEIA